MRREPEQTLFRWLHAPRARAKQVVSERVDGGGSLGGERGRCTTEIWERRVSALEDHATTAGSTKGEVVSVGFLSSHTRTHGCRHGAVGAERGEPQGCEGSRKGANTVEPRSLNGVRREAASSEGWTGQGGWANGLSVPTRLKDCWNRVLAGGAGRQEAVVRVYAELQFPVVARLRIRPWE